MEYWETQDGTEIEYKKLEDDHLLNILKFIKRKAKEGVEIGGGQYYGEGEEDFWTDTLYGNEVLQHFDYKGLRTEAKRRGLIK
jgi:hypothetical protein